MAGFVKTLDTECVLCCYVPSKMGPNNPIIYKFVSNRLIANSVITISTMELSTQSSLTHIQFTLLSLCSLWHQNTHNKNQQKLKQTSPCICNVLGILIRYENREEWKIEVEEHD